jgi:two-component system, OmpR family, KDP operon response regulator KdpE
LASAASPLDGDPGRADGGLIDGCSMRQLTALVAAGEPASGTTLNAALEHVGFTVRTCDDHAQALRRGTDECPDLVVIRLSPPDTAGLELLRRLRLHSDAPVVVLGPHSDEGTNVRALDLGADDYVALPCSLDLLCARVRAVLRRLRPVSEDRRQLVIVGDVTVDFDQRRLFLQGREVGLSPTEWQLLAELAAHQGRLIQHEELLSRAWGPEYRHDRQYLRVGIRRLRRKLEDDSAEPRYIRTVPGVGYVFGSPLDEPVLSSLDDRVAAETS